MVSFDKNKEKTTFSSRLTIALLLFLVGGFIYFYNLGLPQLGKAEGRIAEVVREMLLRRDYFHPTCLFTPYVTKPIIPYWFVIGVYKIRGILDEFTLRIPVAISVLLSALSIFILSKRLFGIAAAYVSTAIFFTSYGVLIWGRLAAPDMLNVLFITVSVTFYWFIRDKENPFLFLFLGVIVALSGHMKGLVGVVIPLLLIGIDIVFSRRFFLFLRPRVIGAFLLGLFLYVIPFLLSKITSTTSGYNWISMAIHESVTRAIKPFDHKGTPFMYLEFLPIWMLPWTPIFLLSIIIFFKRLKELPYEAKWLGLSILAIFFLFTLAGSRRSYYILPILPFCAIFIGLIFELEKSLKDSLTKWAIKIQSGLFLIISLLLCLLAGYALIKSDIPFPKNLLIIILIHGIIILFGALFIFHFLKRDMVTHTVLSLIFTGFILSGGFISIEKSYFDGFSTERAFAKRVKALDKTLLETFNISYYHMGTRTRTRLSFYLDKKGPIQNLTKIDKKTAKNLILISEREDIQTLLNDLKSKNRDYKILLRQDIPWWLGWPNRQKKELKHQLFCVLIKG